MKMKTKTTTKKTPEKTPKPIPYLVSKDGTETRLEHYWWSDPKDGEYRVYKGNVINSIYGHLLDMPKTHDIRLIPADTTFHGDLRVVGVLCGRSAANMAVEIAVTHQINGEGHASPRVTKLVGSMPLTYLVKLWNDAVKGDVLVEVKARKAGQNYLLELVNVY